MVETIKIYKNFDLKKRHKKSIILIGNCLILSINKSLEKGTFAYSFLPLKVKPSRSDLSHEPYDFNPSAFNIFSRWNVNFIAKDEYDLLALEAVTSLLFKIFISLSDILYISFKNSKSLTFDKGTKKTESNLPV